MHHLNQLHDKKQYEQKLDKCTYVLSLNLKKKSDFSNFTVCSIVLESKRCNVQLLYLVFRDYSSVIAKVATVLHLHPYAQNMVKHIKVSHTILFS